MNYRYTFTGNDFESLLKNVQLIVPGIKKMIAIFNSGNEEPIQAIMCNHPDRFNDIEPLIIIDHLDRISELRSKKNRYDWLDENEVGIESKPSVLKNVEIFDELKKNILLLRFKNEYDGLQDLLLIYLNANQGNYKLSLSNKALFSAQKSIIEYHMFNSINAFLVTNRKNRTIQQRIIKDTEALIKENRKLKDELELSEANNRRSLKNLAKQYCETYSIRNRRNYILTELANEKIQNFGGNINHLSAIIENAIIFTENASTQTQPDILYIDDWHINLSDFEINEIDEVVVQSFNEQKYANTIALLNRLEEGAKIVTSRKERLTGINVGLACNRPMKAPGITDALKNHRSKILTLFQKYPNKWEIIRNEFTPVKNLIISSINKNQLSA